MDKAYNDNIRPLLDLADELSPLLKETNIKIPKIASCGMQSHGKSSTLESITHISLPKGSGTVTVCPIKISLRNAKNEEYAKIKFEDETEDKYEKINSLNKISEYIMQYQNKVKQKYEVKNEETRLFDEVIQVEVNRKNAPNLTLYDLPGLTFDKNLKEKSQEINEKFLKEEETTVLLIMSGSEEISNSFATEFMEKIPDYKRRFNPIITKVDKLENKDIGLCFKQIKALGLENRPSLIINKGDNENITYEEMEKKEIELINNINNINNDPYVYKGIVELINHLIEIQKRDLEKTFSDIEFKIKNEISNNKEILKTFPSECQNQIDFSIMFEKCKKNFIANLSNNENTMKYNIHLKFKKFVENIKIKTSELFSYSFCKEVTKYIIQDNSDNISILEDKVNFNKIIKYKIIKLLNEDFEPTIQEIFDFMCQQILSSIESCFEYKNLKNKVKEVFYNYAQEQKNKVVNFYNEIYNLETENVLTYNNNDLIFKTNNLNNYINNILLGKKIKRTLEEKKDKKQENNNKEIINNDKNIKNFEDNNLNNDFGKANKGNFQDIIDKSIGIVANYENERKERFFESNEFTGRMRIEYSEYKISAYDERIKDSEYDKFYDENKYEFIPGFNYIDKKKLNDFKDLIIKKELPIKTINVITKMISYLEIMLNRVIDTFFLTIKKYLYNKLLNNDIINHISKEINELKFEEQKKLVEISQELTDKKSFCQNNVEKFEQALKKISELKEKN